MQIFEAIVWKSFGFLVKNQILFFLQVCIR